MKINLSVRLVLSSLFLLSPFFSGALYASELEQKLVQTGAPYVKYFNDRAMPAGSAFAGLTRSFQLDLGTTDTADLDVINYGAVSYDQSLLGRIRAAGNDRAILDTYVNYASAANLADANNPLINCSGGYYGAGGAADKILYGLYRVVRIGGRDIANWWNTWDWAVDTGATACFIIDALDAYQKTLDVKYKDFAVVLASYILKLKDSDGGIRYGPRGVYHPSGTDFYWNLKSTEQNERCLAAFEALYSATADNNYKLAADALKGWLKGMYDTTAHLFHGAASYNGSEWVKSDIYDYVVTDVHAFAPFELMLSDTYFGATQAQRDLEVEAMFAAMETRVAFLNASSKPVFFRFSVSQTPDPLHGDYGSVEWSAQMALAYLRISQSLAARDWSKAQAYLDKYQALISFVDGFFAPATGDSSSLVAPYASFYNDKTAAGNVPTGTGYDTFNCQAALASVYHAYAKAGYDPIKPGGGAGIPSVLNLTVPWFQNTASYYSSGAASAQMILAYMRDGTGQAALTQNQIYEYARAGQTYGPELSPDEVKRAMGHFDPYDVMVSNSYDVYDAQPDGNPYQGYNFSVETFDPSLNTNAMNNYMRDICHWMAYTVTKEEWWKNGDLVLHPNTPALVPLLGTFNHWGVVKGFAVSANPCPEPHTNPHNTPDFTVYGFWIKDPLISGIGQDTYKTADECKVTYFKPVTASGTYNGKLLQIAEPPPSLSQASTAIAPVNIPAALQNKRVSALSLAKTETAPSVSVKNWKDIVDPHLLYDPQALAAFSQSTPGSAIRVRRLDLKNRDYYLIPFNKTVKGKKLTSAVVMLDAQKSYFKEATWSAKPEKFLKVDRSEGIQLIRKYILSKYIFELNILLHQRNNKAIMNTVRNYSLLFAQLNKAAGELAWEPSGVYSTSAYQPYWKFKIGGYNWFVTQSSRVSPEVGLNKILKEIQANNSAVEKLYSYY